MEIAVIVKIKYDTSTKPGHYLARVWMGDVNLPYRLAGILMFTEAEWISFKQLLKDGALFKSSVLILSEEADGSSRALPRIDLH